MTTLKEIAKICNVSPMTVSNVINGKSKASKETQEKILKVVKETGYTPNYVARGLRNQKTNTIALICEDIAQFTSPYIIEGAMSACEKAGYRVVMQNLRLYARWADTWYDQDDDFHSVLDPALQEAKSIHPDGMIYVAGHSREINCFDSLDMPVVMAHAYSNSVKVPSIVIDDEPSAYEVIKYLISMGHKKIGVIAGRDDNTHTILRIQGYKRALKDYGIEFNPDLIIYTPWSRETGYEAAKIMIKKDITAIFCIADQIAGGVYDYLQEQNIRIPEDISVIGYDDAEFSRYMTPKLTTTAMPLQEMGATAASQLIEKITGEKPQKLPKEPEITRIPCTFTERNSVKRI